MLCAILLSAVCSHMRATRYGVDMFMPCRLRYAFTCHAYLLTLHAMPRFDNADAAAARQLAAVILMLLDAAAARARVACGARCALPCLMPLRDYCRHASRALPCRCFAATPLPPYAAPCLIHAAMIWQRAALMPHAMIIDAAAAIDAVRAMQRRAMLIALYAAMLRRVIYATLMLHYAAFDAVPAASVTSCAMLMAPYSVVCAILLIFDDNEINDHSDDAAIVAHAQLVARYACLMRASNEREYAARISTLARCRARCHLRCCARCAVISARRALQR